MRAPLATAIAIAVGLIVLAGYFLPDQRLQNVRSLLLDWSILLAAVATLVAIINLVISHFRKAAKGVNQNRVFSIVVLVSFFITFMVGMFLGPANQQFQRIVTHIQVPIESTLLGVLSISLAYSAYLFTKQRRGWANIAFMTAVVFFLLANSWFLVFGQAVPVIGEILTGIQKIPLAGSRGVLIGISLGSLLTGLRILTGIDRPYSG
jgi:hypothetical protein